MRKFIFITGPIASGKSTFLENRLFNEYKIEVNFFDNSRTKLMIGMYATDKIIFNDQTLEEALENAVGDSIKNNKDILLHCHFMDDQLVRINAYFERYKDYFQFEAHFIGVNNIEILIERAKRRELLGGRPFDERSIKDSFDQSFRNLLKYLSKFDKVTIWDNSKEYGLKNIVPVGIFEGGKIKF